MKAKPISFGIDCADFKFGSGISVGRFVFELRQRPAGGVLGVVLISCLARKIALPCTIISVDKS
jgi:hypothetical protein